MALVDGEAATADRGRARFLELAAMQIAVARGLGFAGVYVAGQRNAAELDAVLSMADAYAADEWRSMLAAVSFPAPGTHRLFEQGDVPHSASDRPAKRTRGGHVPMAYRLNRLVHDFVFDPDSAGFAAGRRLYAGLESAHLGRPLHLVEQAAKVPLFGCRDCGDCSLPEIAYQCPESACAKNQRNGPCGGTLNGECEVPGKRCVWTNAYDRLVPYGEALSMLERAPVLQDNALRGTSAWANAFLGRDHHARDDDGGET
jgi:methylenetetrahydrofolate reductase (NADPH)